MRAMLKRDRADAPALAAKCLSEVDEGQRFAYVREAHASLYKLANFFEESTDTWKDRGSFKKVHMWTKKDPAEPGKVSLRCLCHAEDVPLFNVIAMVYETDLMPLWVPGVKNCKKMNITKFKSLTYSEFPMPFPFKTREACLVGFGDIWGKAVTIFARSVWPEEEREGGRFHGIAVPHDRKGAHPRTPVEMGGYYICKGEDVTPNMRETFRKKKVSAADLANSTVLCSIWKLDFPAMVPEWLYIQLCKYIIAYVLHVMRTKAKTIEKGLPEIAARIKANNLNAYSEIKRRIERLDAPKGKLAYGKEKAE